ncbi:thiamine pyrophosphate-binding protein [Haliangium sp. UPWRP_2]|uniref:thiamine pyrophosphate-binding protein n=1 Tax=Haliangium sp. UPWRP_2 TaxID=1931276 RepID=UPI000B5448E8|nr:thiamine pyrophosphate-binding protein [Haliangium sp. UPWRP_2]PSM32480.1 acetolactate synthase [Haliangium sp. UPWRP_2]
MAFSIGGHLVAEELHRAGVRDLFTLCGGHIAPIYDGCLRYGIRLIDTRHEQAAAHAGDGYARLTRGPGVALVTAGPGVTDAVTGVANAYQAQSPLVLLGGAAEVRSVGRGALQEMEQLPVLRSITKWSATCTDPRRLREMVQTALRVSMAGTPGPVFLELPFDILMAQVDHNELVVPPPLPSWPRTQADPASLAAAVALLAQAEHPVIFAGSQVYWEGAHTALGQLCATSHIPVVMNGMGRGTLPADHPQALNHARKRALRGTDLVVLIGTPLDFRIGFGAGINPKAKIIQIDRDPTQFNKNRAVDVALSGSADLVLAQLADALAGHSGATLRGRMAPWLAELHAEEERGQSQINAHIAARGRPINHYQLSSTLAQALGAPGLGGGRGAIADDAVLIGDGGDVVGLGSKVLPLRRPGQWLDPGPLGCLGVGAPFAIAAKALDRDNRQRVVVLSGDGSFGLNGFDFETCIRFGMKVTVVVGNDAAWGQIRGPQVMLFGTERSPATKLAPVRYDRVVEAFGGVGFHVENPDELLPTLRQALDHPQVACVNVALDPEFVVASGAAKLTV